jgi:hypothetical protein
MSHDRLRPSPDPTSTNSPHEIVPVREKDRTRAAWKANERHVLPENRFWIVFPGLMCCIFLAALDQVRSQLCFFIIGLLIVTDHCCNCFTDHRPTPWRGKELQLGWKVPYLSSLLSLKSNSDHFLPQLLPPCG